MREAYLRTITGKMTIVFLIASGWASGAGIAAALDIATGFDNLPALVALVGFTLLGFGISTTALHLYSSWQDDGAGFYLILAMMLSLTTIMGFLTKSTGNIEKSVMAKSALEVAQDHYYGLQASYNQLRMAQRLRDRQELEPKLENAKATYLSLVGTAGAQAASLSAYRDIARAFGWSSKSLWWFMLVFFAVATEASMATSHLTTRKQVGSLDKFTTSQPVKRAPVDRPLTKSPSIALDKKRVDEIVNLWRSGLTNQSEIARRLDVSRQYVNQVINQQHATG